MAVPVVGRAVAGVGFFNPLDAVGRLRLDAEADELRVGRAVAGALVDETPTLGVVATSVMLLSSVVGAAATVALRARLGLPDSSTCATWVANRNVHALSPTELSAGLRLISMAVFPSPLRQGCSK
jgi:hypothetical protein